jgi:taurine transport system substrate-binding protein
MLRSVEGARLGIRQIIFGITNAKNQHKEGKMKTKKKLISKLGAVSVAALAIVAASCSDKKDDTANSAESTTTVESTLTLPEKITIGYQNIPNGDIVVKHEGLLEEAFGSDVSIEWKLFDSGGSVNEAIVAGGIDIGLAGSSPVSRGISQGIEYQVPWIHDVIGEAEALVVNPENGISTIADLKGKTIATPFASTSHYSLLAALEGAGLAEADVKIIDSEPDAIYAAWQQGDIDAAYVWNPNLAAIVAEGGEVLITSAELAAEGKTTYDLAVVSNSFAEKYPDAVQLWIDAQNEAVSIIKNDTPRAAAAIAAELNITEEEATAQLSQLIFVDASTQAGDEYLGGGLAANLYAAAVFNKNLGKIESVEEDSVYQDAVVTTFVKAAK